MLAPFTDFPEIAPFFVRLSNALTAPGRHRELTVADSTFLFRTGHQPSTTHYPHVLHLVLDDFPARLEFAFSPSGFWQNPVLNEVESIPDFFRTALLAAVFEDFVNFLEQTLDLPASLAETASTEKLAFRLPWTVSDEQGQLQAEGLLHFAQPLGEVLLARMAGWPRSYFVNPESILLDGNLVTARVSLSVGELRSLQTGDVVLLDAGNKLEPNSAELLFSGGFSIRTHFSGDLSSARTFHPLSHMSSLSTPDPSHSEANWAQDIEVEMQFVVGTHHLSVKELMELAPGQVLELNQAPQDPVAIVVNGRRVGHGHLVKIGDQLGIQVADIRGELT